MTAAQACDLMTIGHSNLPADRFITLLRDSKVSAVIDVRSVPFSRWCPWFSSKPLATGLAAGGLAYLQLGDELGGRPRDPQLYCDGIADYEAMARRPEFRAGLDRVIDETRHHRVCLLCSEREPLDCHRCLLVGRALAERGVTPGHIRADGTIEPHAVTEQRLLKLAGGEADLFGDPATRLADAYRQRTRRVAARRKP
ncbi:MAG: hypothetical protein QOI46_4605 [Alphaproteobacteria bacterium]|nr:hypothetical protein [Alphaproteobacteria bacterium]